MKMFGRTHYQFSCWPRNWCISEFGRNEWDASIIFDGSYYGSSCWGNSRCGSSSWSSVIWRQDI